ncbi:MAG: TetR/AcrR family transcriptional regulator [Erythrobacter sp.]|nr:TetR/AcrR family transcriptional regulator [Erythrobacter sp.]MBA4051450.1 TetR/AcrR family transcriptional regulator [Erythrobacter sp.]MBA4163793.1 TetR/AcrR family transcriptional regulator [Erythrobacter sp.]
MPQNETIRDAILDAAEGRARVAGYNGFSFRDLANDVGIKSASVHYHFPTKGDLAHELMERYRIRALETLGSPEDPDEALRKLTALFRAAATGQEMCLCGALGVSSAALPEPVQLSAKGFSHALMAWLKEVPGWEKGLPLPPETLVSLFEGALLLSITARDPTFFEVAIAPLVSVTDSRRLRP